MNDSQSPAPEVPRDPFRYTAALAQSIERKWQDRWELERTFHAPNPGEPGFDAKKPKKVILDMFPYPSGVGLHVGHPLGYIATDVYARYLRMTGHNVLHPMGYDAFGLPAEQYAVQTGQHPRVTAERNIATMRAQMRRLGLGHDPGRSLATTDVEFYRWTQWIFLQIFNSWYDADADRARPIRELLSDFESGRRAPVHGESRTSLPGKPIDGRKWKDLSEIERRIVLDSHRLAYLVQVPVNWCPALGTVLANEEVTAEGRSERGNHPVFKRPLKQWMMRITAYCERLLQDLEPLEWPEPIKLLQRNWIGRSEGAEVDFVAERSALRADEWFDARQRAGWQPGQPSEADVIRVFTTRPDTLYGATYMVLAPEHPLVDALVPAAWPTDFSGSRGSFPGQPAGTASPRELVAAYRRHAAGKSDVERQVESKEKTGVFIGAFAINPVNRERVPIFIADYVLMGYGTGAIMAVPAHDERDFVFAKQLSLPIRRVVRPVDLPASAGHEPLEAAFSGEGVAMSSSVIDGLPTAQAKRTITEWLHSKGLGRGTVNYRLRDWLFSRQRYWGEPFPIVYDETGLPIAVDEASLPVELPEMKDYAPETSDDPDSRPSPPLARAKEWAVTTIRGKRYSRELNTMPNWAGSCWYYLRYWDPRNASHFVAPEVEKYWSLAPEEPGLGKVDSREARGPRIGAVDLYVGGVEHAVLHLLYARFWHKVLFDLHHVSTPEPFQRLINQGYVQAAAFQDEREVYVEATEVEEKDGRFFHNGKPVTREFGKMGKSLKNAVSPDGIFKEYGADTLRLYEMYMGPLDASKPWNTRDIVGVYRFLQRFWRNIVDEVTGAPRVTDAPAADDLRRRLHKTIESVRGDMVSLGFNTAIARLIELNNAITGAESVPREVAVAMVKMLAPLAPHAAEELWEKLGSRTSIVREDFPVADPTLLVESSIEVPVMISKKVVARLNVPPGTNAEALERIALADARVKAAIAGKKALKVICVPDRMVNIVLG